MKTRTVILIVVVAVIVAIGLLTPVILAVSSPSLIQAQTSGGYLAVIKLSGVIAYEESPLTTFGGRTLTPDQVREMVKQVEGDSLAKAVLLAVNSPGGSAAASEEIYLTIKRLAEEKVVVAYIEEYGASGGYYITLPADEIVASPVAITGSVGAVAIWINIANLTKNLGIETYVFKSGGMKDIGNVFRTPSGEELEIMQSMIEAVARQFVGRVREERGESIRDWDTVLTARPFTGEQAVQLGLIDRVGSFEDAKRIALEKAGLPETAPVRVIKPREPGLLELLFGGFSSLLPSRHENMQLSYEILAMWPLPSMESYVKLLLPLK